MTGVVDALLHLSGFPRHREERSDVTIRFSCGSCILHWHCPKKDGLPRLALQASQ